MVSKELRGKKKSLKTLVAKLAMEEMIAKE